VGSYEHGNKPTGSIKGGEFMDKMSDYKLLSSMELVNTSNNVIFPLL
jgi:hypothetical protein